MSTLSHAIRTCQQALTDLNLQGAGNFEQRVLQVLLARDQLAAALTGTATLSPIEIQAIAGLDQQLKGNASDIEKGVGREVLAQWREARNPTEDAWWWSLDQRVIARENRSDIVWMVLAGFSLTLSLSFSAEIARRFLQSGPDWVSVFSTMVQAVLTLLAGSTFLDVGKQWMEQLLKWFNIERDFHAKWTTGFSLLVLLLVLGLRFSLPTIAVFYNNSGQQHEHNGHLTSAIHDYQRAISLHPDYAQAHYNLASASEDMGEYDTAISEYRAAIQAELTFYAASNNLARLLMVQGEDYASALNLLDNAFALADRDPDLQEPARSQVRYTLLKNRGWAYAGGGYLLLAEQDLCAALALREDGAAAHCLLAQVLEAKNPVPDAEVQQAWEHCISYAPGEQVEATWLARAQEYLLQSKGATP